MKDTSLIEGETVAIEYRLAGNQIERLSALATELVRRQVAAIASITSALVARAVTTSIPIVFVAGEDPVTLGLDANTSPEIDGAFATAFFREPPDALFLGDEPPFARRQ